MKETTETFAHKAEYNKNFLNNPPLLSKCLSNKQYKKHCSQRLVEVNCNLKYILMAMYKKNLHADLG